MSILEYKPSRWSFVTSESAEFAAAITGRLGIGFIKSSFFVRQDGDDIQHELLFVGVGVGVGVGTPIASGSYSDASWPSTAGRIYQGPCAYGNLGLGNFSGPGHVLVTSIGFGGITPSTARVGFGLGNLTARGKIDGASIATPGVGATLYTGGFTIDP